MTKLTEQSHQPTKRQVYRHRNQRVHIPDGYMAVGLINNVHGLKGEVKVEIFTDFPERFAAGTRLFLGDALEPILIQQARPHKGQMLLVLEGITSRAQADELRGGWLFIPEDDAFALEEGVYWIHDIVGLAVETTAGQRLGVIQDVLETGANDVYVIRTEHTINNGRDILLPALADVVTQVDLDGGIMVVDLPAGLIDEPAKQEVEP